VQLFSPHFKEEAVMPARFTFLPRLAAIGLLMSVPVLADLISNGGTGAIVMGVAPYGGAPNVGGPTYIADSLTGRNDILTSPGLGTLGGYLTADPVLANNIQSTVAAVPLSASQVGGGNGNGDFGSGSAINTGSAIGFALADSGPGGGSASYLITGSNTTLTDVNAPIAAGTSYGAYLSIGGAVPLVGNADVVALRVHVSDTAGVFGAGGTDLPQLVLAISRNGAGAGTGNYNIVTIGGVNGGTAALVLDNGVTGAFRALAVDNLTLGAAIPVGDVLSISTAMTAFSDPASFSAFDPGFDLLALTGPLPLDPFVGVAAVTPEPATWMFLGLGIGTMMFLRRRACRG
jgi:hypothetical protein